MKIKITRQGLAGDGKSAYYSDHTTPLPIGEWDVKLKHQVIGCSWYDVDLAVYNRMDQRYRRQIYLSPLPPAQPVKAVEEEKVYQIRFRHRNNYGQFKEWIDISKEQFDNRQNIGVGFYETRAIDKPYPIETPAIATGEGVEEAAERATIAHYKPSNINAPAKEYNFNKGFIAGASHILTTHVPVDEVEKIKSVLKQIRRVELLTPETEALINKILNP